MGLLVLISNEPQKKSIFIDNQELNMLLKSLSLLTLLVLTNSVCSTALAYKNTQVALDKACEDARNIALKPRRKEIYLECKNKFKKSDSVCKSDAKAYNGNRIGGAPMFYELPACEKAFQFRKKQNQK